MASTNYFQKLRKKLRQFTARYITGKSLRWVERFVFVWVAVFVVILILLSGQFESLDKHYLASRPSEGGKYVEGIVGEIGGINPLFPESRASRSASVLVFSGLFKNGTGGQPVMDLAEEWSISDDETVYTVKMREDAYWHDGEPVTAVDTKFTFDNIQNPDVGSPYQPTWQGIEVEQTGEYEIKFKLPNPFAPFLSQLTVGILPQHLLDDVEEDRMRITGFNTEPVGSGPFEFEELSTNSNEIRLRRNTRYYKGPAKLEGMIIRVFDTEESMVTAYNQNQLSAMMGESTLNRGALRDPQRSKVVRMKLASQVFAFFNTERLKEKELRQALSLSVNRAKLIEGLGNGDYEPADSPLLPEHIGYKKSQPDYDRVKAAEIFESTDWSKKDGQSLSLVTQDNAHYIATAEALRKFWKELGVTVEVTTVSGTELQQDYIRPRDYDILLFGIGLDNDPDVYAYWHSSQIKDPGLNLSVYDSAIVDDSLEAGRTRSGEKLRAAKYEPFLKEWRKDAPAAVLYRIHNYYIFREDVSGIEAGIVPHANNRFHNVHEWTVNTKPALRRQQQID